MIVDTGGLADQQRIVLGDPPIILLADQFDIDAQPLADPDEVLQRMGIRRWQRLLGIMQDCQVITGQSTRARQAPDPATETVQGLGKVIFLVLAQLMQSSGFHPLDMPAVTLLEFNQQYRTGEYFK